MIKKHILVCGAGGLIGTHLVEKLVSQGHYVVGVDIKYNEFKLTSADKFIIQDLTDQAGTKKLFDSCSKFDEVYNLAAVMGGMEFLATGEQDYKVLNESTLINWNVLDNSIRTGVSKIFFSSSACAYSELKQLSIDSPALKESDAYPAYCDLEYGYQKLISERIYNAAARCHPIEVRIGRFHNIYGPYLEIFGDKAKAPAALCRKVILAKDGTSIDVIGDGLQTRSFTWIGDCIDGVLKLMESNYSQPINIGSDELISINDLAKLIIKISGKELSLRHIEGPQGVRGRNSDNTLIKEKLGWAPPTKLAVGIEKLYKWIDHFINTHDTNL